MKARSLILAAALVALSDAAIAQNMPPAGYPDAQNRATPDVPFAQSKAHFLQRIEGRQAILQSTHQCIDAAQNMAAAKVCFDQEHAAMTQMLGVRAPAHQGGERRYQRRSQPMPPRAQ